MQPGNIMCFLRKPLWNFPIDMWSSHCEPPYSRYSWKHIEQVYMSMYFKILPNKIVPWILSRMWKGPAQGSPVRCRHPQTLSLFSLSPSFLAAFGKRWGMTWVSDALMVLIRYNIDVCWSIGDVFILLGYYIRIYTFCKLCVLANVMGACVWVGDLWCSVGRGGKPRMTEGWRRKPSHGDIDTYEAFVQPAKRRHYFRQK